jgi:hypothetical protein
MAGRYVMTARRKAALRKAQIASARKRRKGKKIEKYGASRKTATLKQRTNRVNRAHRRVAIARVGATVAVVGAYYGTAAYRIRKANADIAYTGKAEYNGNHYNQQGGPRVLRVTPTAKGHRRRAQKAFIKAHGKPAFKAAKAKHKSNLRAQRARNRAGVGKTTMQWMPRDHVHQTALSVGRGVKYNANVNARRRRTV